MINSRYHTVVFFYHSTVSEELHTENRILQKNLRKTRLRTSTVGDVSVFFCRMLLHFASKIFSIVIFKIIFIRCRFILTILQQLWSIFHRDRPSSSFLNTEVIKLRLSFFDRFNYWRKNFVD